MKFELEIVKFNTNDVVTTSGGTVCDAYSCDTETSGTPCSFML